MAYWIIRIISVIFQIKEYMMNELISFPNLIQTLRNYAEAVIAKYRDKLIIDGHIATGKLINKITANPVEIKGNTYSVSINLMDYWKYVEEGVNGTDKDQGSPFSFSTSKTMIPSNIVLEWIKVDGKLPSQKSLAWVIAKSIHEKGIKQGKQLEKTLNELNDEWTIKIIDAVTEDLSNSVGIIIENGVKPDYVIRLFS